MCGRLRRRVAVLALAALCASAASAVADDSIATRFEVFGFAGIRILTLHSLTEEHGDRYAVTVDYATRGLASVFVDLTTRAQVAGRLAGAEALPDWFRSDSRRNGVDRRSRLDYRRDGGIATATTPPLAAMPAAAQLRGTIDNLTAYFRLERQLARTGSCALSVRVFDGRHAYELAFSNAGRQALSAAGGQRFSGEAIACAMVRKNRADFPDPEQDEGARSGTIWYARMVPGDLLVPVRTKMDTQLGVVDGFLAELHGNGRNLRLME